MAGAPKKPWFFWQKVLWSYFYWPITAMGWLLQFGTVFAAMGIIVFLETVLPPFWEPVPTICGVPVALAGLWMMHIHSVPMPPPTDSSRE